jgi:uncharacterized protein YyaL (SSP411 family)
MTIRWLLVVSLVLACGFYWASADGRPNYLSGASSQYLKRAERQPVNWYPWSAEAFAEARRRDVPVLLDVGAVWCPWCSLMDRESYTNPETAAYINVNFIAVKVDFDQDPRLSAKLQRAQALLNLPAGLPLTAFVTPEGKLYSGGAYFPAEARDGKPAFREALADARQRFRQQRSEIGRDGFDLHLSEEFHAQETRFFHRTYGSAETLDR